jgi:hypothetical protein
MTAMTTLIRLRTTWVASLLSCGTWLFAAGLDAPTGRTAEPPTADAARAARGATIGYDSVRELHDALVAALSQADEAAARELFVEAPVLFVLDHNGEPVTLSGERAVRDLVALWAVDADAPEPTRVVSTSVVAEGETCVALVELERPMSAVRQLRATSVVARASGEAGSGLKIQHMHVSRASRADY